MKLICVLFYFVDFQAINLDNVRKKELNKNYSHTDKEKTGWNWNNFIYNKYTMIFSKWVQITSDTQRLVD